MKNQIIIIFSLIFIIGCSKEKSKTTGWNYNDPKHGGFEISTNYTEQVTPDGMAFIEGGSFTMGRVEQDVIYDWNNVPKTVTVSSFYMDETEVRNLDYLEYLFWIERVYGSNYDNGSKFDATWKDSKGSENYQSQKCRAVHLQFLTAVYLGLCCLLLS